MDISENTIRKMQSLASQSQGFDNMVELKAAVDAAMFHKGPPLYVVFLDGARRGSIGRLVGYGYQKSGNTIRFDSSFNVEIDGRPTLRMGIGEVSWLKGYNGPTLWKFTRKPKPPAKVVRDRIGSEVNKGDMVAMIVDKNHIEIGNVTRITDKGSVFIKCMGLNGEEPYEIYRGQSSNKPYEFLLKLNDNLFDRLVLAKLAS